MFRNKNAFQQYKQHRWLSQESFLYCCGSRLAKGGACYFNPQLTCQSVVEQPYYSKNMTDPVCHRCGDPFDELQIQRYSNNYMYSQGHHGIYSTIIDHHFPLAIRPTCGSKDSCGLTLARRRSGRKRNLLQAKPGTRKLNTRNIMTVSRSVD